ncbi:MAG: 50S ribosomal protein L35 [bacterium]|nr:50S ribosomal protein L35 [bacterium]
MKKTNKSYAKRVRVTKSGKVLVRKPGVNHFNAKKRRNTQLKQKRRISLPMSKKGRARFLSNI